MVVRVIREDAEFGHPTFLTDSPNAVWRYWDNGEAVDEAPTRPCMSCNMTKPASRHDPCIENLPEVRHACCGHGLKGYVGLKDGRTFYFVGKDGPWIRELVRAALAHEPIPEDVRQGEKLAWWAGLSDPQYDFVWANLRTPLDIQPLVEIAKATL